MQLRICKDQSEWTNFANEWLSSRLSRHSAKSVYLPAGETPRPLYGYWEEQKPAFLKDIKLIQIDDVATGPHANLFKNFFCKELPSFQNQFSYFRNGDDQAQLAMLGLGLNGHVAFHEPEIPIDFYSGCVRLTDITKSNLKINQPIAWGKTYGIKAFMQTKGVLLLIRGEKKKPILQKLLSKDLPTSILLQHNDLTILCDFDV